MNEKKGFLSLFNCPSKSIWLHNTFFYGLHKSYLPAQRSIISFGSSIFTVIIMPILPKNLFRWSSGPPFSVDEIRMKVYYLNASFLWLALPNPILACGNVIRISSPKFFFSMKSISTSATFSLSIGLSLALFFFTSFKGEWRPSLEVVARSKGYNTYETLASLTFWGITFATTLVA